MPGGPALGGGSRTGGCSPSLASPSDGVLGVAARVVLDASALWEGCCLADGAFGGREGAEPVVALGLAAGCCDPDVPTWVDGSATGSI